MRTGENAQVRGGRVSGRATGRRSPASGPGVGDLGVRETDRDQALAVLRGQRPFEEARIIDDDPAEQPVVGASR